MMLSFEELTNFVRNAENSSRVSPKVTGSFEESRQKGIQFCIEKLGRDFVFEHKNCATSAFGLQDNSVFCYVGVYENWTSEYNEQLILDNCSKFSYYVSCLVDMNTGEIELAECVLPE